MHNTPASGPGPGSMSVAPFGRQRGDDGLIRARESVAAQVARRDPAEPRVLGWLGVRVDGPTVIVQQLDEAVRIPVYDPCPEAVDGDRHADFLEAFTLRGALGRLAGLALPPRE